MFDVTNFIQDGIRQEAIISACIVLIWFIIAMIGIIRALVLMFKGGDEGVYAGAHPTGSGLPPGEKYELNDLGRVPTYEQATRHEQLDPSDNHANRYRGQAYTLTARPMPTVEITSATSPILHTGFSPPNEKMGTVNGQYVDAAIRRPTHIRASSHGDYEQATTPTSALPQNPFADTKQLQSTPNPFADPVR
jgi:hypothetical protein